MDPRHECARYFAERHPEDAARLLDQLAPAEVGAFLESVSPAVRNELCRRLSPGLAAECLRHLKPATGSTVLGSLPHAVAAGLLRRLDPEYRTFLLNGMEAGPRKALARSLDFPAGTAGALADPHALSLAAHVTVADVRSHMRRAVRGTYQYVYVVDDRHRLIGVLHARDIAAARAGQHIGSLMREDVTTLAGSADVGAVLAHPAWREHDPLPVVDPAGTFLGVLRHRHLRQLDRVASGSLADTMIRLGEIYWLGLYLMVPGLGVPAGTAPERPTEWEVSHDR